MSLVKTRKDHVTLIIAKKSREFKPSHIVLSRMDRQFTAQLMDIFCPTPLLLLRGTSVGQK